MVEAIVQHGQRWASKEMGASSSMGVAIALSDSEGSDDDAESKRSGKMKMVAAHQAPDRYSQEVFDKAMSKLFSVFPNACPNAVAIQLSAQLKKTSPGVALQRITNKFLENGVPLATVEKQEQPESETVQNVGKQETELKPGIADVPTSGLGGQQTGTFEDNVPNDVQREYLEWSMYSLKQEFPRYPIKDLNRVWATNNGRFAPSHKIIRSEYAAGLAAEQDAADEKGNAKRRLGHRRRSVLNKHPRNLSSPPPPTACIFFERELTFVRNATASDLQQGTSALKNESGHDGEDENDGDTCEAEASGNIECGCCCSDYRFEEMAQCAEGHLFCFNCLRRWVEESTFGGTQACGSLPCMDTGGCKDSFPWSEVKRALPPEVLSKYEQRQAEDAVIQAKLSGLVYCPFCNMPWEVDPDLRVLDCANDKCRKASCLLCREPSHIPLRCEEVEKKSETSMRRSIEELMTKALIRVCSACKAELVKSDGCNKITCRCGQTMCYVCRKPIAPNYQHFCQHTRAPGKDCSTCKRCSLWQEEREDEVVTAAREAALKDLAKEDPNLLKRTIGPKIEKAPPKRQRPPVVPAVPFQPPPPEYYHQMVMAMIAAGDEF